MIGTRIREALRRRRRGTVALLAVAAMIPVTAMFAASMNGGQMVDDRRHVQDASDALATMHGTWTARSLNVLSMNNVTSTQLMTVAIGSEALAGTIQELEITAGLALAYIAGHGAINCPTRQGNPIAAAIETVVWTIPCVAQHALVAIPAGVAIARAISINNSYRPNHGIDVSHKALEAIDGMNHAIVSRFPRAMAEIGAEYTEVHGIEDFHFADPCNGFGVANCTTTNTRDGMALPLEEGGLETRTEFCAAMEFGTVGKFWTFHNRGFPFGSGPMRHGGSSGTPVVKDHINDTTEIGKALKDFKDFYESDQSDLFAYIWAGPDDHPQAFNLIGTQEEQNNNSFTRRYDSKRVSLCVFGGPQLGALDMITRLEIEAPVPTFWKLKDISPLSLPIVQPDQMPDAFRILAFSVKDKSRRLATAVLNDNVESHFGYAQVGVFNPDGADLFSQNWRFRMMPSTRMEDPTQVSQDLQQQARAAFGPLATSLGAVTDVASWERVNAH